MTYKDYLQLREELEEQNYVITSNHYAGGGSLFFEFEDEFGATINIDKDGLEVFATYDEQEENVCIMNIKKSTLRLLNKLIEHYDEITEFEEKRISDND